MELAWSTAAFDDLVAAADYIENELGSPQTARSLVESVQAKAELFSAVPGSGTVLRTIHGADTGYRYMTSGNWMVFFHCDQDRALVARVLYAKSEYMRILFGSSD